MTIRYKVGFMEHIVDAERVEIEDAESAECRGGKWIFKDTLTATVSADGSDTYTSSESEAAE